MPNRIVGDKFISLIPCGLSILALALAFGHDRRIATKASGSALIEVAVQSKPSSTARSQAGPCESQPIYEQFDFWVGEWDVKQAQDEKGASVGSSRIEKTTGGCVILENWESTGFSGKSWNFYDIGLGKWRQIWIDVTGRKAEFIGEYRDDAMRLEGGAVLADGRKVKSRMTFFNLGPGKVRQLAERSTDGGRTWTTTVDYLYLRRKQARLPIERRWSGAS